MGEARRRKKPTHGGPSSVDSVKNAFHRHLSERGGEHKPYIKLELARTKLPLMAKPLSATGENMEQYAPLVAHFPRIASSLLLIEERVNVLASW